MEKVNLREKLALFTDHWSPKVVGDLKAGQTLDDFGGYDTYGQAVAAKEFHEGDYLPEGIIEGCVLKRDLAKDAVITYADVTLPEGRLVDQLRAEQKAKFFG